MCHANAAKPSPNAQSSNVQPLPLKGNLYARLMEGEVQAQKRKLVGNVALKQRPFMVARPALLAEHFMKK